MYGKSLSILKIDLEKKREDYTAKMQLKTSELINDLIDQMLFVYYVYYVLL